MKPHILFLVIVLGVFLVGCTSERTSEPSDILTPEPIVKEPVVEEPNDESEPTQVEFDLVAKKFEFVPNTITVNKGDTVVLHITSEDVEHGFSISEYDISETISVGEEVTVEFLADKPGEFTFRCSVFCGSGHTGMAGTLNVL